MKTKESIVAPKATTYAVSEEWGRVRERRRVRGGGGSGNGVVVSADDRMPAVFERERNFYV